MFVRNCYYLHLYRVVLRIGSKAPLSQELVELQEEVKPLWKVPSCPRDFKRTTVERFFREAGFALDWCAFRLVRFLNIFIFILFREMTTFYKPNCL